MRRAPFGVLAASFSAAAIACASLLHVDAVVYDDDANTDAPLAALQDAGADGDPHCEFEGGGCGPSDGAADASSTNLLDNPGFEQGVGGCGIGWTNVASATERSDAAHTGSVSCLLCTTASQGWLEALRATPISTGESYYVEAWVSAPEADAAKLGRLYLATSGNTGFIGPTFSLTSTWTRQGYSFVVPADAAPNFTFSVDVGAGAPGCMLVDDVYAERR